jgi:hypothetical protein
MQQNPIKNKLKNKDSKEYLKKCIDNQPFVFKAVEIILNDKNVLDYIGPPIKLISHDLINSDGYYRVFYFYFLYNIKHQSSF